MKRKFQTLITLTLMLSLFGAALAALPPLSPEAQEQMASDIVVATVGKVEKSTISVPGGTDTLFTMQLEVGQVEKGALKAGQSITATCQKTAQRPEGMVGPQGQNQIPAEGDKATFYLTRDGEGPYKLLQPNGWSK